MCEPAVERRSDVLVLGGVRKFRELGVDVELCEREKESAHS